MDCVRDPWPKSGKLPRQGDTAKGELRPSDVGPILRRFLTRADDCFDDRLALTLCDELVRGQVPERAVRMALIVVHAPRFDIDRPAHSSPRAYRETSEPILGAGRASDFFRRASESMCLSSGRSATSRLGLVFSSFTWGSRRSSLTPRCAYFFFPTRRRFARRCQAVDRQPRWGCHSRPGEWYTRSVLR